jgi:hypothetical protein
MKRKLKLALASVCVVAAGFGGMKAYNHYNNNQLASNLLSEDVEALSNTESWMGKACKWIAGALACFDVSSDPEPKTYAYLAITPHQCKKRNGEWGNQDICANKIVKTDYPPKDECVAGWSTPCR